MTVEADSRIEDGDIGTALALLDMQNEALRAENYDLRLKFQELARENRRNL